MDIVGAIFCTLFGLLIGWNLNKAPTIQLLIKREDLNRIEFGKSVETKEESNDEL